MFTCILTLISWGWTITFYNIESFDIFIPVAVLVGIFKILIVTLGKVLDEEEFKMHHYHGFIGIIIFTLRVGFYIYFLFGLNEIS